MQTASAYIPSTSSLQHRAAIAQAFSGLRRVRPRVPFWKLGAHRLPTLWTLYRGLLRNAPGDNIRWRMRMFFEQNRSLTSPTETRNKLVIAHKWLDAFAAADAGDEHLQKVLLRYDSMISAKCAKESMKRKIVNEVAWQERLRTRPILTGALIRASIYNRPLPRMHPDPQATRMMIHKRRLAREKRGETLARIIFWKEDVTLEREFEHRLDKAVTATGDKGLFQKEYEVNGFITALNEQRALINESYDRDAARMNIPVPPSLIAQLREARREKFFNKARESERARRGEVFAPVLKQRRKGPPAHILCRMSPERRKMDRVVRSPSEVGYVGMVKRHLGFRLRDDVTWRLEEGEGEARERIRRLEDEVNKENERRRRRQVVDIEDDGSG